MKKSLFLLPVFALSACYTEADFVRDMNSYIGQTEEWLVMSRGVPQGTYSTGSLKVLQYSTSGQEYVPERKNVYLQNSFGQNTGTAFYNDGNYVSYNCTINFFLQNGRVIRYSYSGNKCFDF